MEDDEDLRLIFSTALSIAGFDVRQASDGIGALNLLEIEVPDLLVLDLLLPVIDGFTVQQEVAARKDLHRMPVVVVTAAPPEELRRIEPAACVLQKPVMPDQLVDVVRRSLESTNAR